LEQQQQQALEFAGRAVSDAVAIDFPKANCLTE
jgi:hypothetical protein